MEVSEHIRELALKFNDNKLLKSKSLKYLDILVVIAVSYIQGTALESV